MRQANLWQANPQESSVVEKVLITGANGNLGTRLVRRLRDHYQVLAIVRSERARQSLLRAVSDADVRVVDYNDRDSLSDVAAGCNYAVHLVGIIKRTSDNTYQSAHQGPCAALAAAATRAGMHRIVYLSLLGSDAASGNPCLSSRGQAEDILLKGSVPAAVIRVPMVLGENDYASRSLSSRARSRLAFMFRSGSLEQPIYAGDVIEAIVKSLTAAPARITELAGPESLPRRALVFRAAQLTGASPLIVSLPLGLGMFLAGLLEAVLGNPPITRDMLGVLDHDDEIDAEVGATELGIELTRLDDMLASTIDSSSGK